MLLAENLLRPTLARAESRPRPAQPVRLHAGGAAGRGGLGAQPARTRPAALLANRLDVLERSGLPEAVLLGYRTMARIAARRRRRAPRARAAGRAATPSAWRAACRACASPAWPTRCGCMRAASAPRPAATCARRSTRCWPRRAPRRAAVAAQRRRCCARWRIAYAAIAAQDWRRAAEALARADGAGAGDASWAACTSSCWACAPGCSTAAARSRCRCCARRSTWPPTYGLLRVFDDAHPGARRLGAQVTASRNIRAPRDRRGPRRGARCADQAPAAAAAPRAIPSMALTPKEREVLELLGAQPLEQGNRPGDAGRAKKPSSGT